MSNNGKYTGFDENIKNKLDESSKTLIGAPITTGLDTAYAINAPEINWAGYKLYDEELTSTGHMLSYIETQLDSKATTSSGVWDDIKDSAYITTQINIYASYTTSKTAPDISWTNEIQNDPMYDGVISYLSLPGTSTPYAQGWFTSIDDITGNNKYVFMSSIYIVKSLANNILGYHGPSSTPIYLPGESGINGNFKSTVFCRTNTTPKAPSQGAVYSTGLPTTIQAYNLSNAEITGVNWSDGIPSGQEILWATTAVITDSNPDNAVWSTPRQMTDTATYDVEFSPNESKPPIPSDDKNLREGQGWYDPNTTSQVTWENMKWRAERECINGKWGNWIIVRIKGEQGTEGLRGAFKSTVFTRSETTPQQPTGGDYNSPIPTNEDDSNNLIWSDGIPNGTGPVWSTWRTFVDDDNENNNSEWAVPTLVADTPTYDVEFAYIGSDLSKITSSSSYYPNDGNRHKDGGWYNGQIWFDPTNDSLDDGQTFDGIHDWSYMIWRAERNRATTQDAWSNWVITKIKGEDGKVNASLPYHEQRWACFSESENVDAPNNIDTVGEDDDTWKLTFQYESGKYTWMTTRPVIYDIEDNVQTAKYVTNSSWSTPIRITPKDGINGEANPIQPVLKYTWYNHFNDGENYPAYLASEANPNQTTHGKTNVEWYESPGNPSGDNKYLWMIQGERFNGNMRLWNTDGDPNTDEAYWTSPVCLSGKDGEPGADGDDIEFIYKRFSSAHDFTNDNPSSWYTTGSINKPIEEWAGEGDNHTFAYVNDYLGPNGSGWYDNPQGVDSSYKYEYATYRKTHKINGESYWEAFNTPFAWSIYGENGIDGDGVEYIYYTYSSSNVDPVPPIFDLDPNSFQKSEVYGEVTVDSNSYIWHDDPQTLDNNNQKFQWVSTRKYIAITSSNVSKLGSSYRLNGNVLQYNDNDTGYKVGDKIWFPYSDPELWNWYTENGTDAARIVMIYRRNNSGTVAPELPQLSETTYSISTIVNGSQGNWAESPGNSAENYAYLWMSSAHYTNKTDKKNKGVVTSHNYTLEDSWQTPVCLTGEPGNDGADGTDIEFIYYRTADDNKVPTVPDAENFENEQYNESDWPFVNLKRTHDEINNSTVYDSAITKDGIKYLINDNKYDILEDETISSLDNFENITSDMLHDVWTDNPLGVTSTYDYEYASIRKKIDGTWQDFCKPFLWSKYGEDGVDGDGVEYIYYLSHDKNEVTFDNISQSDNDNSNNPANWAINQSPEHILNEWSDDPSGVSEEKRWEYVSVRHKRLNNTTGKVEWGKYSEPAVWSHFAVDALATSLVFETDNDMIAVSVDDNGHVTKNATSTARMYLYHDTKLVSTSYYNVNILDSNLDEHNGEIKGYYDDGNVSYSYLKYNDDIIAKVSLSNNTYVMEYNIPQGFDMSFVDDELRITTSAYIFDNSFDSTGHVEVGSERPFINKVKGLHIDLSDIYQIQTDKNVVKKNPQNELENVTITLKSLTSNSRIDTTSDAVNKHLFILYKDGININRNTLISYVVEIGTPITLNDKLSSHEFELWYNPSNTYWVNNKISSHNNVSQVFNGADDILLDKESLSLVWDGTDGKAGTDSKSQEYIYYRSELPVSTWYNAHNPSVWSTHENVIINETSYYAYCTDDFPFIAERTSYNNWYDHPQGIDGESYLYEYVSTREYDTSTKEWGSFSEPVAWATWGHTGEDGDGVEYIYYRSDSPRSSWIGNEHPTNWFKITGEYQSSEYIHSNATSIWKDNPQGVAPSNKYEYASIRKYKKLSYKDWNNFASTCKTIGYATSLASLLNRANTNIPVTFTSDEQLYNLRDTIITLLNQNVFYGDAWQLNCGAVSLEILNAVISSITTNEKYWSPYSEPKLWAKYGEQGPAGESGSSSFIIDFDNDNLQLAVNNSNNTIKGDNFTYTLINLYSGTQKISYNDYSVSILHSSLMFNDNPLGYIVKRVGQEQYYTPEPYSDYLLEDIDNWDNGYYFYIKTIENSPTDDSIVLDTNNRIQFNISYNDLDYAKSISIKPVHFGADGAPAETFELMLNSDDFKFDQQGNPTPSTVTAKIKHRTGRNVEILSYTQLYTTYNNDTWAISYFNHPLNAVDARPTNTETGGTVIGGKKGVKGVSSEISSGDGAGGGTVTGRDQESQIHISVGTTTYSDVAEILEMGNDSSPDYITWNLYMNGSLIDFETTYAIYDGSNGRDGFGEEFIYSLTYLSYNNTEDPSTWYNESNALSYTDVDYIPDDQQSYWFDHPQGITPLQPVEWASHRTWNTLGYWNPYEAPVKWSHYGEDGMDGDGVEYIYAVGDNSDWKTAIGCNNTAIQYADRDPRRWILFKGGNQPTLSTIAWNDNYQTTEYHRTDSDYQTVWEDDPIKNLSEGYYQFCSTRKYKLLTQEYINNITISTLQSEFGFVSTESTQQKLNTVKSILSSYIGQKIWFPYSEPTIWSSNIRGPKGEDGLAINLILDSDNDMMAVAINNNGTTRNASTNSSIMSLHYNTNELATDYWDLNFVETNWVNNSYIGDDVSNNIYSYVYDTTLNTNISIIEKVTLNETNHYKVTINIPQNISLPSDGAFTFTTESTVKNNYSDSNIRGKKKLFTNKVIGLSLSTIYQLRTDKSIIKRDNSNNYDGNVTATVFNVSDINDTATFEQNLPDNMFVFCKPIYEGGSLLQQQIQYDSEYGNCMFIYNGEKFILNNYTPSDYYNPSIIESRKLKSVEFNLIYTNNQSDITNIIDFSSGTNNSINLTDAILVDKETVYVASNGEKGTNAFALTWTNDRINFGTNELGNTTSTNQSKTSTLQISSLNNDFEIQNIVFSTSTATSTVSLVTSDNNYTSGKINCYINGSTVKLFAKNANIPNEGITITFDVTVKYLINNTTQNIIFSLFIFAQHTAENGKNAVSYEIISNNNFVKILNDICTPQSISFNVYKYDGDTINIVEPSNFTSENLTVTVNNDGSYSGLAVIGNNIALNGSGNAFGSTNPTYINLILLKNGKQIDIENIPILRDGEKGAQGFGGPVVRNCGVYSHNRKYGNGNYNRLNNTGPQYDGTSILYKDIVSYTNKIGTKFYTPSASTTYITETNNTHLCQGSAYIVGTYPAPPNANSINTGWIAATQFDFVATKLLYADQALINQISSHDFIATTEDGIPVAGMTSGKKEYGKDNERLTLLNNANNGDIDTGGDDTDTLTDTSHVRMFAGQIWKQNGSTTSYSLTYAPFNVRQDGTAYMSKAIIEGTVTASNLKLKENVNANTVDQKGSFTYWDILNGDRYVPNLNEGEVGLYYILSIYGNSNSNIHIKTPYPGNGISRNAFFKKSINGKSVLSDDAYYMRPPKNTLCQLVGINADNITYWNIIETPLAEQKIPDTILEHYDCTDDVILFAYNLGDYYTNNNTVKISYLCTRADDYDGFLPIRKVTFNGSSATDADDVWVEYTFLTYLQSNSSKHTTNGAYANLGFLRYVKNDYKSSDPQGESINPNS